MAHGNEWRARARVWCIVACIAVATSARAGGATDADETWIDAWMARDVERHQARERGDPVPFAQLGDLVGESILVWLDDGRVRRGEVERVDRDSATLRAHAARGYYSFTVQRRQVQRIERDEEGT